jgi:hypothetical protein
MELMPRQSPAPVKEPVKLRRIKKRAAPMARGEFFGRLSGVVMEVFFEGP